MTRFNWDKFNRTRVKPPSKEALDRKYARFSKKRKKIVYQKVWGHCKVCNTKMFSKYKTCYNCFKATPIPSPKSEKFHNLFNELKSHAIPTAFGMDQTGK